MHDDIDKILLTKQQIAHKVKELAQTVTAAYKNRGLPLQAVIILKGASIFAADLLREVELPAMMDYMAISSYGAGTVSSGVVRILKDLDHSVEGHDVLVIEDIVDSGRTLRYLMDNLKGRGAASVQACVLLDKPERREADVQPEFVGFEIPDEFVVGYGLDYAEKYRNLPYIGVLKADLYLGESARG